MHRFLFVLFAAQRTIQAEHCPHGCPVPTQFYEELKCKPVYEKPTDCCPLKYDCPDLTKYRGEKCLLNLESYEFGEAIPGNKTEPNCLDGCVCKESGIECLDQRCEHTERYPDHGCYYEFTHINQCCPMPECEPKRTDFHCKYRGLNIKDGQKLRTRCIECMCQRSHVPPLICRKRFCTSEIKHRSRIMDYCAPFYDEDFCCPADFFCPFHFYGRFDQRANAKILSGSEKHRRDGVRCRWGDEFLERGDHLSLGNVKCTCFIPPFLTCVKK